MDDVQEHHADHVPVADLFEAPVRGEDLSFHFEFFRGYLTRQNVIFAKERFGIKSAERVKCRLPEKHEHAGRKRGYKF